MIIIDNTKCNILINYKLHKSHNIRIHNINLIFGEKKGYNKEKINHVEKQIL